jgi:ATP-dependent helicase/nuclease subunit B
LQDLKIKPKFAHKYPKKIKYMQIRFGLMFQELTYPEFVDGVEQTFGEAGFLAWAELQVGLQYIDRQEHLRVEQYRQILEAYLNISPNVFFARSFEADSLATAATLLSMRDELLLSGWNFALSATMPIRLRVLAEIEGYVGEQKVAELEKGFAERFLQIERAIRLRPLPVEVIWLNEPLHLMPPHWARLLAYLSGQGVQIQPIIIGKNNGSDKDEKLRDLDVFQQRVLHGYTASKQELRGDGSLIILQATRQSDAALFLAKLRRDNPNFAPVCLIDRQKGTSLDIAMIHEGLPSLGIQSASLARPTLQIIKLATAFLWKPINPYKLLEFVSLPNKPMHDGLARKIADALSRKPGLFSSTWNGNIASFFDGMRAQIEAQPQRAKELRAEIRQAEMQYNFWLARRRRYDSQRERVPARACIEIFEYLQEWADEQIELLKERAKKTEDRIDKWIRKDDTVEESQLVRLRAQIEEAQRAQIPLTNLHAQASRIVQVLEALPREGSALNPLELERIIRSLEEPSPLALRLKEVGHWAYFTHTSAISAQADTLLWWDFVQNERVGLFSRWYSDEAAFLAALQVVPESPKQQHERQLWQARRPIAAAKQRLILVFPQTIGGADTNAHPFWSDLQSIWGDSISRISFKIACLQTEEQTQDKVANTDWLEQFFILPQYETLEPFVAAAAQSYLQLTDSENIDWQREEESYSGLDTLLYTPYDWVFKYKIDLRKSSILSVSGDETIKGNLSHALLHELFSLLKDAGVSWTKTFTANWFDKKIEEYIASEGATLQMYGKEADRTKFIARLRAATINLVDAIQENNWKIVGSEVELLGNIGKQPIRGIADLLLQRGQEFCVVDIKWSSGNKYLKRFDNNEDLQLVIYSHLACEQKDWAHTAYYSLQDGKFVSRNNRAFRQALCNSKHRDLDFKLLHQDIWNKIETTYQWRLAQLEEGIIALHDNHSAEEDSPQTLHVGDFSRMLETHNSRKNDYSIYKNLINLG